MFFSLYAFEELRLPMELLWATLIFCLPFAEKKSHFPARAIIGFICMTLLSLLYFPIFGWNKLEPRLPFFTLFWYIFMAMLSPLYARLCFQIRRADSLLLGSLAFSMQNIIYSFFHIYVASIRFPQIRYHLPLYILMALLNCLVLYTIVSHIYAPILNKSEGSLLPDSIKNIVIYFIIYILLFLFLIFYQAIFSRGYSIYDKSSWISGIMVSILILAMEYSSISALTYAEKTKHMEELLSNSEHYYELSKEHISIINRKCHDLKHQLKVLRNVSDEERNEYIAEAEKSILFYQNLIYTDNEALNTILAEKGLFCSENDINFNCSIDDVDLSSIRVSDLYSLLGNAIDNAIEYVKKQNDPAMRSISLRMTKNGTFIGIQISNPITEEDALSYQKIKQKSEGNLLYSTKKSKAYHGFGLKSIRYIAEKYDGHMEYSAEDGLFILQIILLAK